jgi:hypothetical protein
MFRRFMLLPSTLHPEDGSSMDLRNFGNLPQHYKASQPRRPRLSSKERDCYSGGFIIDRYLDGKVIMGDE